MKSLFLFSGRISRSRFWLYSVIGLIFPSILIFVVVAIFGLASFGASLATGTVGSINGKGTSIFIMIVVGVALISAVVIAFSAMVRRFHDRDKSGWWSLISFIPYIGGIWIVVECGCLKGTTGSNRFGSDPLTPSEQSSSITTPVVTPAEVTQVPSTP